ncbi:hypothetical protein [Streptomyces sp. VRA16 Mangrove soil]|uniref:hypothetical protein n=1 Tax=Streptomyces sp. VRA16 Mangrove soil TaxID=2817434 RepID=UPI001A9D7F5D|nr:hypothetical protein [Streptomyces sp. VRA16 Mangrove soil]MBO1332712.1 hypothetical protein [Streptomyces sp. VRA16 Mangrove soil]
MSVIRPSGQTGRTDRSVAVIVVLGDLLVCVVLLLMSIGAVGSEPTTRAQETAAWHSAGKMYVGCLVVGVASFAVLRMPRALLAHVATMLLSPIAVLALLLLPGLD